MNTVNGNGKLSEGELMLKQLSYVAMGTAVILLMPLLAMQFTSDVNWGVFDFVIMGALLMGMGAIWVVTARKVRSTRHRILLGAVLGMVLFLMWAELAVGIFGSPFAGS